MIVVITIPVLKSQPTTMLVTIANMPITAAAIANNRSNDHSRTNKSNTSSKLRNNQNLDE